MGLPAKYDPTDQNITLYAYDGSIAVPDNCLVYHDTNDVKPFSSQADTTVADLNERQAAMRFAGVAVDAKTTTSPAGTIGVAREMYLELDCASSTFEKGDMVGPVENGAGDGLENQKVQKVTDASKCIGVVQQRYGSATTRVKVRLEARAGSRVPMIPLERGLQGTGVNTETLAGNKTLVYYDAPVQALDPGGAGRNVILPAVAVSEGKMFWIINTADAAEVLTIQGPGGTPNLGTPTQNEAALCICAGGAWKTIVGATT